MQITVQSSSIDWQEQTLEITDTTNKKHRVQLDTRITVTMIGYPGPDPEQKTMLAHELGDYMLQGYIILQIEVED